MTRWRLDADRISKANALLETSKGIFRLRDEAHVNLGIATTAQTSEIPKLFAT